MNNVILHLNSSQPLTSDNIHFSNFFWGDNLILKQQAQYLYFQTYVKGPVTITVEYDEHGQTLLCNRRDYRFIQRRIVAKLVPIKVVDTKHPCFRINFYDDYLEQYPQLSAYRAFRCGDRNIFLPQDLPEYELSMALASQLFESVSHNAIRDSRCILSADNIPFSVDPSRLINRDLSRSRIFGDLLSQPHVEQMVPQLQLPAGGSLAVSGILEKIHVLEALERTFTPKLARSIVTAVQCACISEADFNFDSLTRFIDHHDCALLSTDGRATSSLHHSLIYGITPLQTQLFFKELFRLREGREFALNPEKTLHISVDHSNFRHYGDDIGWTQFGLSKSRKQIEPIISVAVYVNTESGFPIGYRILNGNVHDSKSVPYITDDLTRLGLKPEHVVSIWDRGYMSERNIELMLRCNQHFLANMPKVSKRVKDAIDENRASLIAMTEVDLTAAAKHGGSRYDVLIEKEIRYDPDPVEGKRQDKCKVSRVYLYINYDAQIAAKAKADLKAQLVSVYRKYDNGTALTDDERRLLSTFSDFKESEHSNATDHVLINEAELNKALKYAGFQVLLSDMEMTIDEARSIYQERKLSETRFQGLKLNGLDASGARLEQGFEAKLFILLIAEMVRAEVGRAIKKGRKLPGNENLRSLRSIPNFFNALDSIRVDVYDNGRLYREATEECWQLFDLLGLPRPKSQLSNSRVFLGDDLETEDEQLDTDSSSPSASATKPQAASAPSSKQSERTEAKPVPSASTAKPQAASAPSSKQSERTEAKPVPSTSATKPQAASAPSSKQSKRTVAKPAPSASATKPQAASAPSSKQSKRTVAKPAPSASATKPQAASAPSSKQIKRTVAKPAPSTSATKPQAASAPSSKQSKRTVAKPAPSTSATKPQAASAISSKKYSVPKK